MSRWEPFLAALPQSRIELGLDRIASALEALGRPQSRYPGLLVAGTNGKGSTCAFLDASLRAAGMRVGLTTSPHLVSFRERIRIDGEPISDEALDRAVERLQTVYPPARDPAHPDALTYFEAGVALAFEAFAAAQVDVAVIEVGLGGRLDATNVPGSRLLATVVTRLGLDHVEILGGTIEAIALEKGSIARPGVPLVSAPQAAPALAVLQRIAAERGAPLVEVGRDATLVPAEGGLEYEGPQLRIGGLRLGLRGGFQAENAAVAVATLEASGLAVGPEAIRAGLSAARWPGRIEVVSESPLIVLDGAHNPDGARALADAFPHLWPGVRPAIVFGMLGDKDREAVMEALLPLASSVHVCAPDSPRAVPAERMAAEARGHARDVRAYGSVAEAIEAARCEGGPVLICGSLYLVGEARRLLCGDAPAR